MEIDTDQIAASIAKRSDTLRGWTGAPTAPAPGLPAKVDMMLDAATGGMMRFMMVDEPLQGDFTNALRRSPDGQAAVDAVKGHRAHLVIGLTVADTSTEARIRAAKAVTMVAAEMAQDPNCVGICLPDIDLTPTIIVRWYDPVLP